MKLYYGPAAGAMASHITIRELGLDVELVRVDLQSQPRRTESGDDYLQINPKGYVPHLVIDATTALSESVAILQYLADQGPEGSMSPPQGSLERYELQEWLTFVGTELQRLLSLFFIPGQLTDAGREFWEAKLHQRLAVMDTRLADNDYLMGADYTIADAYAFTILNWIPTFKVDVDLSGYRKLGRYLDKIRAREAVQAAMREEGLLASSS